MKFKLIYIFVLLTLLASAFVYGAECDANAIISESKRITELEGKKVRDYIDETNDNLLVEVEAKGWDWLGAVQKYVKDSVKNMVLMFALSFLGALILVTSIFNIFQVRANRHKFISIQDEVSRLSKIILESRSLNKRTKNNVIIKSENEDLAILNKKVDAIINAMQGGKELEPEIDHETEGFIEDQPVVKKKSKTLKPKLKKEYPKRTLSEVLSLIPSSKVEEIRKRKDMIKKMKQEKKKLLKKQKDRKKEIEEEVEEAIRQEHKDLEDKYNK